MKELGQAIAAHHAAAARIDAQQRDHQLATTTSFMWDNFEALEGFVDSKQLSLLADWTGQELAQRNQIGEVRLAEPASAHHERLAEVAQVRHGATEGGDPQPEKDAE